MGLLAVWVAAAASWKVLGTHNGFARVAVSHPTTTAFVVEDACNLAQPQMLLVLGSVTVQRLGKARTVPTVKRTGEVGGVDLVLATRTTSMVSVWTSP